ncbi:hypothetical protein GH714_019266 [Hevea brasiliensis]|uniref:Mo25 family protein n=1 Tax=Hevea brasiliensis TaxID=3981 RepID=A0A6A6MBF9_HEVBR|nr:hypothetical protein GH714_019266 [Hevea brasiliensis]
MLCGDGEVEPNIDQVSQLVLEVCKEDVLALVIHKLPNLGWERERIFHCWSVLLKQKVDSKYCSVEYENHFELLDFLVVCYDNKEIALNCGLMLRECIKFPTLAKYILESASFELFFKFVELPNFDVASDAFSTFKDLLTKHGTVVAEYLTAHYDGVFNPLVVMQVFVANPNKPREVKVILAKNNERLVELLDNLSIGKGSEDEQFEEEKELIIKEIKRLSCQPILDS